MFIHSAAINAALARCGDLKCRGESAPWAWFISPDGAYRLVPFNIGLPDYINHMKLWHVMLDFLMTPCTEFQMVPASQYLFAGWLYDDNISAYVSASFLFFLYCLSVPRPIRSWVVKIASYVPENIDIMLFLIYGGNGNYLPWEPLVYCSLVRW